MLRRKIEDTLIQWKSTTGHKPLVIMGIWKSRVYLTPDGELR